MMNLLTTIVYSVCLAATLLIVDGFIITGVVRAAATAGLPRAAAARASWLTALALVGWLVVTAVLAVNRVYVGTLIGPAPRIAIGLIAPLVVGIAAFALSPTFRQVVYAAPLHWLVAIELFRMSAVTFIALWAQGLLPASFVVVGIGDILVGLSAVVVASMLRRGVIVRRSLTFIWTLLATLDLLNGVVQVIRGRTTVPSTALFAEFPFALVGSYMTPLSLLILGFIFVKLIREGRSGQPIIAPRGV
jgi:hypothetical protein